VAKKGGWVAKLEARLLASATLWVRIQTLPKIKMGDIRIGVADKKKISILFKTKHSENFY
jgi:hypothetical protein